MTPMERRSGTAFVATESRMAEPSLGLFVTGLSHDTSRPNRSLGQKQDVCLAYNATDSVSLNTKASRTVGTDSRSRKGYVSDSVNNV